MTETICTIEARMGSSRLPGKVLKPLAGRPMLEWIIDRVQRASRIDRVVVVTATGADNDPIVELAERLGVDVFRGSEDNVLSRVAGTVRAFDADTVVSLTGDNPFVDPELIDDMIARFRADGLDYLTTTHMIYAENWDAERTFPRGVSVQVVSGPAFVETDAEDVSPELREHSTMAIYRRSEPRYMLGAFGADGKYAGWRHPELRMTVDTPGDFDLAERLYAALVPDDPQFSTGTAIALLASRPDLQALNSDHG